MGRRARGPGAQHEQRCREIADAVLEIVAERGLPAVSLSEVAARAGVSAGRVQHYFPSKKELIEAAFDRGNDLSSARINAKIGQDPQAASPRAVLTVVLTELIPYDPTTRVHMRVRQSFTARALADEAIAARLRQDYARLHQTLSLLIRSDQDAGRIPATADPEGTAAGLVALAEGLAYYVLIDVSSAVTARDLVLSALAEVYG